MKKWSNIFIVLTVILGGLCPLSLLADSHKNNRIQVKANRKLDYFYYEGLRMKQKGQIDDAFELFNRAYEIDSTASAVLYELSSCYKELERDDISIDLLTKAVKHDPTNFTYQLALATMQGDMGKLTESTKVFKQLTHDYPEKSILFYYLAEVLAKSGDHQGAIDAFNALENDIGLNDQIVMRKYMLYQAMGKHKEAFAEVERLIKEYPKQTHYYLMLGDLYLKAGENEKAYANFKEVEELDPTDPHLVISLANYYEAIGNSETAITQLKSALLNERLNIKMKVEILSRYINGLRQAKKDLSSVDDLFATLTTQNPENTQLRNMYGSWLQSQNKFIEAKEQFETVTEIDPTQQEAWNSLLHLALQGADENPTEMMQLCKHCITLFPKSSEYYFYLAIGYYKQKDLKKSIQTYKEGLEVIPKENTGLISTFYGQIGDVYYEQGDMKNAYAMYDEALVYNEKNVLVLNNYSYFLTLDKKDLDKAERMSALCVKLEPNNSTYLDTYAWVFFVKGNYTLAKIYIKIALEKDATKNPELYDHYGDILYMKGDIEAAVEQWEKAKEMGKVSKVLDYKIKKKKYKEENPK